MSSETRRRQSSDTTYEWAARFGILSALEWFEATLKLGVVMGDLYRLGGEAITGTVTPFCRRKRVQLTFKQKITTKTKKTIN